jgi:glycosyltransferase family protein
MSLADKSSCKKTFDILKKIWDGQDIVFIEGEKSRLGVGNDLFDNAKSIQRILGPVTNAFDKYNELLECAKKVDKAKLILLALGPCATALSYDLFLLGYRAIDLGHADIEYEWFLQGSTEKQPVKNKFVNEAGAGKGVGGA